MDDLLQEFLTESAENVERLEQELVLLEKDPHDADLLGSIFRSMHTIKGTCGFLGLGRMESVSHAGENVLGALRDRALQLSDEVITDILAVIDVLKEIMAGLEATEEEPEGDDTALVERLDAWLGTREDDSDEALDALFAAAAAAANAGLAGGGAPGDTVDGGGPVEGGDSPGLVRDRVSAGESTLRVDVDVLDRLMNLAGELVLTRNQILKLESWDGDPKASASVQQLNRVTAELQDAVMKTRMQPVGNAWSKLPRLVRDLSTASGKRIELSMSGAETELDRQVLQAIRDPLTHMVRNSADHGIEMPRARRAAGKPESGRIALKASHEGGHIVIELSDDGRGLNRDAILQKALDRGLTTPELAEALPDPLVYDFIFEPGFTTAEQVSAVSGRGVGMDVVRQNIHHIGGTIQVDSAVGVGTTFRIRIPLTLAIMSALVVRARDQSFALPQVSVRELVRISNANRDLAEQVSGSWFYRLRGSLLPLVHLNHALRLGPGPHAEPAALEQGTIVVCEVASSRFGLVVDRIMDTEEIVVKPVGRMARSIPVFAGTTILGDGRVIMILDANGIAAEANVLNVNFVEDEEDAATRIPESTAAYLLFDTGGEAPRALPLEAVTRLEEVPASAIESAAGHEVIQYRGQLLPVVAGGPEVRLRDPELLPVIVIGEGSGAFGIAVNAIRDIVRENPQVTAEAVQPGLLGTVVLAGRTTEMVDAAWFQSQAGVPVGVPGADGRAAEVLQ